MRRLVDVLLLGIVILARPLSRRPVWPLRDEGRRALPGDDVLPAAKGPWTHAITIRARPEDIWPWLVQMGCRRAGWYSYDGLDNGGVPSAGRIVPAWQRAEVGDLFAWTPTASDGFIIDATHTRLLTRSRGDYTSPVVGLVLRFVVRPIHFAMQRKQLLNLKRRVEATAAG